MLTEIYFTSARGSLIRVIRCTKGASCNVSSRRMEKKIRFIREIRC